MITLFLETSTGTTGIAVTRDGRTVAESVTDSPGRKQNSWLLPEIERMLTAASLCLANIDLFACTKGPGAFTGIRTGIATIQGLAFATSKPATGISSLAMLAMNLPHAAFNVCPMLDARKNEVYAGLYRVSELPEPLLQDRAVRPEELLDSIDGDTIFIGDGAVKFHDLIYSRLGNMAHFPPASHNNPRPSSGAWLAEAAFKSGAESAPEKLLPSYLRLSEAEISRQQKF